MVLAAALAASCSRPRGEGVLVVTHDLPPEDSLRGDRALKSGFARFAFNWFLGGRLVLPSSPDGLEPSMELGLADRIEVSDGGRLYTVRLSPEARFASGTPVRAADVVASISPLVPPYLPEGTVTARALDEHTVELRLQEPQASFAITLGFIRIGRADQMPHEGKPWVLPIAEIDAAGPFRVAAVREHELVLAANPNARPAVHLAGVVLRRATNEWQELGQMLDGSADMFYSVPESTSDSFFRYVRHLQPVFEDSWLVGLVLNCADPRLSDRRVREALNLAVDRPALIRRYKPDSATPAGGYAGEGRTDPAEAARLLDAAGWVPGPDGIRTKGAQRLVLEVLIAQPAIESIVWIPDALRSDLAQIGVGLRGRMVDQGEMKLLGTAGRFETIAWWHNVGLITADYYRDPGQQAFRVGDWGRCRDDAMLAAMRDTDAAASDDERAAAALRFHSAATRNYPMLFLYSLVSRGFIHGRFEPPPPDRTLITSLHYLRVPRDRQLPRDDLGYWLR